MLLYFTVPYKVDKKILGCLNFSDQLQSEFLPLSGSLKTVRVDEHVYVDNRAPLNVAGQQRRDRGICLINATPASSLCFLPRSKTKRLAFLILSFPV